MPAIRRMVLFGSLVSGTPTPRSDADILVVVETSDRLDPRHRLPEVLAAMAPLPCSVDLFVLTEEEVLASGRAGAPLVREALASGVDLLPPQG